MPQVPYSGAPTVALQSAPTPRYTADTPIAAFGGTVAQATEGLGAQLEGAGKELFVRANAMQDLYNHSQAQEADAQYMEAAGRLHADYSALSGKDAVAAYPKYIQDLQDARKGIRDGLPNSMAQKLYDSQSLGTMGRTIFNGAGHAAIENKKYALGASNARIGAINDQTLSQPADDRAFTDGLAKVEQEVRAQGALAGIGDDATEQAVAQAKSRLWSQRITGMAKQAPIQAGKWLEDAVKRGDLRGEDIAKVTNLVQQARNTTGARVISNTVASGADGRWGVGKIDIRLAQEAIGQIESGGNYSTVGVMTAHGRALGKYQIMEEFLPDYLRRAGMPQMTRDEFLRDHAAQDKVFAANFAQFMEKTGSANDAASMWLTGKTLAEAGGVKDAHGTNAQEYVRRFNVALAKAAPLSSRVAMATGLAREQAPDDPLFPDYVEQRVTADYNRAVAIRRDDEFANRQVIESGLMGGDAGKLPTTVEELTADPQAAAAWDKLPPATQRRYMGVLARNAKGDHNWTDASLRDYQRLKGMAQANPAEFLDQDVVGTELPWSARRELINLQGRLKGKAEGDPRVVRAINILRPDLQAAGIDPKDKDQWYQFTGALSDQLEAFAGEAKKQPTIEEVRTIGSRLLQQQGSKEFWFSGSRAPMFTLPVPSKDAAEIKADPMWGQLGITPTDQQVQRIYTRKLYQDLYGGTAKTTVQPPVSR
jgi:hypothetical protein